VRNAHVARTSKSPKSVAKAALEAAQRVLPFYTHPNSPQVFTQHQLFACLVLKNFLKTDYRGIVAHLAEHPQLREVLRLKRVPHFTTLQKASRHLLASEPARRVLESTIRLHYGRRRRVASSAVDSTGLECTAASGYFVRRRHRVTLPWKTMVYHRYPKLGLVCDTSCHFILSIRVGRGPRPDVDELVPLLTGAVRSMLLECLAADAGYDSEANHRFARQDCGVRTMIPPKHGRPTDKPARGHYRRLMQTRFDDTRYHRRAQVETVMSMIKRRQGAHVRGRTYHSQCRDLRLMALTHNVMILLRVEVFY
jgi:Transposase DDE domain